MLHFFRNASTFFLMLPQIKSISIVSVLYAQAHCLLGSEVLLDTEDMFTYDLHQASSDKKRKHNKLKLY